MTEFKSGEQLTAQRLNEAFAEAMSDRSPRDYGSAVGSDANRIRVRLDYPYRAPMGAVVGIDFPIRSQTIEDTADVLRFLKEDTIYSCSKNQYRHHNRIAILEQPLLPGQIGWAVISGLAKTFWHAQRPPYTNDISELNPDDTSTNLPPESTNSAIDEYRHLGILPAIFGVAGDEHSYDESGEFKWNNRGRPWWLSPFPRLMYSDINPFLENGEYEISYPYAFFPHEIGDYAYDEDSPIIDEVHITQNGMASSRGRAMGISGYAVPDVTCSGTSTITCRNARWVVTSSTCSPACSSWFAIEDFTISGDINATLPCTEDAVISDVPCISDMPYRDFISGDADSIAASGDWRDIQDAADADDRYPGWIVGSIILGTPEAPGVVDVEQASEYVPRDPSVGSQLWMPREFPDPYGTINDYQESIVLRACANLTCTYKCNGTAWERVRGETPYHLDQYWRCKCPDDWMETMADHDLPCTATSQPREFTVGMLLGSINTTTTTTTTTSSTTTTTGLIGACCIPNTIGPGFYCVDTLSEAACLAYFGAYYQGDGTTCPPPAPGEVYGQCPDTTTTTTSSTTTTTSPPTTTTSTTTTTTNTTTSTTTTTSDTSTTTTSSTTTTTEGSTSSTTSSTTTTTEPGSSSTSTTSSTTTTSEGSSSSTTSSTTTTSEGGSSSTTSSTTTTTAFCTGTCDWLCVDSAWQLSSNNCAGGEACDCYSFDLESCSGTGATTWNNCRVI